MAQSLGLCTILKTWKQLLAPAFGPASLKLCGMNSIDFSFSLYICLSNNKINNNNNNKNKQASQASYHAHILICTNIGIISSNLLYSHTLPHPASVPKQPFYCQTHFFPLNMQINSFGFVSRLMSLEERVWILNVTSHIFTLIHLQLIL